MLVGPGWTPVRVGWVWLDMAGHGWGSIGLHWTLAPPGWVPNGVGGPHWGLIGEVGQCKVLRFGEDVGNHLSSREEVTFDLATFDDFVNPVPLDVNVLHATMVFRISEDF